MNRKPASIILPKKLNQKLKEKAERIGTLPEELGVELMLKGLDAELDPEDLVEHYQSLSERYLAEAGDFLDKGDLGQASEKLWGATSLTIKRVAAKRGLRLEKHGSLWDFINKLSQERGDNDIIRFFHTANSLHRNFYGNQMNREVIIVAKEDIDRLIDRLGEI